MDNTPSPNIVSIFGEPLDHVSRNVRPIPPVDLYTLIADRELPPTRGLLDRIAEAMSAPRFILFYLGFYAGCMATVALALIWSKVLA